MQPVARNQEKCAKRFAIRATLVTGQNAVRERPKSRECAEIKHLEDAANKKPRHSENGEENAPTLDGMAEAQQVALERRRWERIPVAVPVFVRGTDENGSTFQEFTTALNISAGGLAFIVRRRPALSNGPISLEIPAAPGPQTAGVIRRIEGRLTRVEMVLDWCMCGLRFEQPLLQVRPSHPKE